MECPLCNFLVLFVIIVFAFIVIGNRLSGRDWYVVIPMNTIICIPSGGAGVDVVYFVERPLCDFIVFLVVVVVALIVVGNRLSGKDG